ncbi:MAG: ATP-binding protein [Vicinamibacteria bacterium]|nr:ATP-binding protein [Vicinamibacteria bacterium]
MLGLRGRMALTALAAALGALVAVLLLLGPELHERALDQTRATLLAEARLMARVVAEPMARGVDGDALDALVDGAAREIRARATIVARDGRVVGDSALSGPELLAIDNHGTRPEVVEALERGVGTSVRTSTTVSRNLLYTAVPITHGGGTLGVARVALSMDGIEHEKAALERALLAAAALAFAIAAALTALLSAPLVGPLREIMAKAREFAAGHLDARIEVDRRDELGELARILNLSSERLRERLDENARDRARTDAILSAMEDGVLAVDARGVVVVANRALQEGLGLEDPTGRHYLEVIRQPEVGAVIEHVLRSGERRQEEVVLQRLGLVFALSGVAFPGPAGQAPGAVLTFHDVTERRRVDRIRRDFVANASHELRTPLTSIRGFVEALEDGAVDEPATAARFLGKIRTHADRMATLVEDLLELSRLESGQQAPQLETVPCAEVTEDVVASFAALAARKPVALACEDGGAPLVVTDGDRLRRILEALVDNALKYTPEGGHVVVRTRPGADGAAVVEVEDDGPGIPAEHLPRIFERFYRVDKARSRELGGTGLGLSIVKHLAEGMGASVAVSSDPGRGSRFAVTLPARPR